MRLGEPAARRSCILVLRGHIARAHAIEALRVHAAHGVRHAHAHEAHHGSVFVARGHAHRVGLRCRQVRRCHAGVAHNRGLLQLFDHRFVFGRRCNGIHAERRDLNAAQVGPFLRKHLVEGLRHIGGVRGHRGIAHAHGRNLRECGLQRREQLALQLRVDFVARVRLFDVAAHVLVEHERVDDLVRVFAVAANRNVDVQADVVIDDAEGYGRGGAVLVAHDFLRVEEVYALVFARVAAEREAGAHALKRRHEPIAEARLAEEQARFGRLVEHEFARLSAGFDNRALLNDDHELAFVDRDDRTVGDDVAFASRVRAAALVARALLALRHQRVGVKRVAVEILTPRIGEHAACGANAGFQQTHGSSFLEVGKSKRFARLRVR